MKLTERKIEMLIVENGGKDRLISDDDQPGLFVRVNKSARAGKPGGRSGLCQYTLHGQKWRVPLGSCGAVSLADLRTSTAVIMGLVAQGRNPAAERKAATEAERAKRNRDRLTLRVLIDDWKRIRLAERRKRYADEAVRALHHAFADHLDKPAEDLDRAAVVRALDALTHHDKRNGKTKGTAIAGRTAAYGRATFAWAVKRGMVQANPFAALPIDKSITKRERALNDTELAEVWNAAGDAVSPFGSFIRLLILTGQRRGEIAGMTASELSDNLATWTMVGERTKNGAAHTVPLSEPARDLIRATLPDDAAAAEREMRERRARNALMFPGAVGTVFSGWSKCKAALDQAIIEAREKAAAKAGATAAPLAPWSIHDLRRTLATGLQRLGVRLEVTEAILNHISGSRGGIAGVYQRHDWAEEKRAALDAWAAHVLAIIKQRPAADNVLNFTRAS